AGLRTELIDRLEHLFESWEIAPLHASMFGSVARGDGDTASDIDLFIVCPDDIDPEDAQWREQIDALSEKVLRWTGNHAGIAEVSARDVLRLGETQPALLNEL